MRCGGSGFGQCIAVAFRGICNGKAEPMAGLGQAETKKISGNEMERIP